MQADSLKLQATTMTPSEPRPATTVDFDEFFRTYRAMAVRWATALVGNRAVAEELAQDAMEAVRPKLPGLDNPAGYLRRTVVNRANSWHRWHARSQRRELRSAAGQPTSYTQTTNEMLGALASLPYQQRAAVALRYWADWTDEQIADALGCAPATVRVLLHRAMATLKKEISE